jgi:hypothetical protein
MMFAEFFALLAGLVIYFFVQVYCGDFIFSGHTMVLLMGFFVIRECE